MQGADPASLRDIHGDVMGSGNVVMNTSDANRRNRNTHIVNSHSIKGRSMNISDSSLTGNPRLDGRTPERKINPLAFCRPFPTISVNKDVQQKLGSTHIKGRY